MTCEPASQAADLRACLLPDPAMPLPHSDEIDPGGCRFAEQASRAANPAVASAGSPRLQTDQPHLPNQYLAQCIDAGPNKKNASEFGPLEYRNHVQI